MKITLFGLAGTGTSTIGRELAHSLGYKFMSTGNIFRKIAKDKGVTVYDLEEMAQRDSKIDYKIDEDVNEYGRNNSCFVLESRLAWFFVPDSVKLCLRCDSEEAYRRIASREEISLSQARKLTDKRAIELVERYSEIYPNIDFPPEDRVFDFVVDTTSLPVRDIVGNIREFLDRG